MSISDTKSPPDDGMIQRILEEALDQWLKDGVTFGQDNEVKASPEGDLWAMYKGHLQGRYGCFSFGYMPKEAIEKIHHSCNDTLNNVQVNGQKADTSFLTPDGRRQIIEMLTWLASVALLTGIKSKIASALKEAYEDAITIAEVALHNQLSTEIDVTVDASSLVKQRGKDSEARRTEMLVKLVKRLPNVRIRSGGGRPSQWTRIGLEAVIIREIDAFYKKAYRKKPPTLKIMADALNKQHKKKTPFTEASLRVLLKSYGLDWKELKKRR
jgi:hypothetical protein